MKNVQVAVKAPVSDLTETLPVEVDLGENNMPGAAPALNVCVSAQGVGVVNFENAKRSIPGIRWARVDQRQKVTCSTPS
jgi:hypothetical protein